MSRPLNSNASSSGRVAPNTSGGDLFERRASTHSIPVSYAYGSPAMGSPRSPARRSGTSPSNNHHREGSIDGASVVSGSTNFSTGTGAGEDGGTGRAKEPASVRYERIRQRTKDTGHPFSVPPPPLPSQSGSGARQMGTNTSVNVAVAFAEAIRGKGGVVIGRSGSKPPQQPEDDPEEEDQESGKETHGPGKGADGGNPKKRKKRPSKDPAFKPQAGDESESEEELGEGLARDKAKRSKKALQEEEVLEVQETAEDENENEEEDVTSHSKKPSTRRKSGDATYRPALTSDVASSSDYSDEETPRRSKKGKGKSRGGPASNAIPIGRRDGEVWFGKKRKGRKGRRSGVSGGSGEGEEEDDFRGDDHYFAPPNANEDSPPQAPASSFFLRPKSPSTSAPSGAPASSPGQHAAFDPDPSFALFDRSIGANGSGSADDSGLRGSSYDYSEEERIVAALEAQKEASSNGLSSTLRKRNRLPGPPIHSPFLDGIREEEPEEESSEGGEVGRKLGALVRSMLEGIGAISRALQNPLLNWGSIARTVIGALLMLLVLVAMFSRSSPPPPTPAASVGRSLVDYIPFFGSSKPKYTPPAVPADSLGELVDRLTILEQAMGQLSTLSDAERTRTDHQRKLVSNIGDQVLYLENAFETERKRAVKALERVEASGAKDTGDLSKDMKGVKADLESLVARLKSLGDDQKADKNDLRRLQTGVESVGKDIASLGVKVAQVSQDVQAGIDAERIAKIALDAIEPRLPSKLAVQMSPSGALEIDPAFWKHLRDAFADKKDVASLVEDTVSRRSGSSSEPSTIVKPPSWEEFLTTNEAALRSWISSDINSRTGSDAIVSKKTFLDILHREIKNLKVDFETKLNENVQKIGEELLNKVAKQEQMKTGGLASLNPFHRSTASAPHTVTIKSSDGQNISELIGNLVDSALVRYSKDILARPDYALYSSGGRVIPSLTSPTYEVRPQGVAPKLIGWITGAGSTPGRPPVWALHPDTSVGSCWPFAGNQGQLGILLSRRVVPSDITLEHASVDVALDGDVSSAPKDFEVWGVVEGQEDITRLAQYRAEQSESRRRAFEAGEPFDETEVSTSLPPTPHHLLLAAGSYDIIASSPIQTFPVTSSARQLGIPVGVVVVKILSNHGDSHYTCLYRIRVSGSSAVAAAAAAAAQAAEST